MPDYRINIEALADYKQIGAEGQRLIRETASQLEQLARAGSDPGIGAASGRTNVRQSGLTEADRAAVRRAIDQMLGDVRQQITQQVDRAAARGAVVAQKGRPASRGGDPALIGKIPTKPEIEALERLLRDRERLEQILERSGRAAAGQREFGLRAGTEEEAAFARAQKAAEKRARQEQGKTWGGDVDYSDTPLGLRSSLSHTRRTRKVVEDLATQKLIVADNALVEQTGELVNVRKQRVRQERASARSQRGADQLEAEAQELAASRAERNSIESRARQLAPQPQGILNRIFAATRPEPGQRQTVGQNLLGKALTTAEFAGSGALLYGGIRTISDMVKQAEQLQRLFTQIEKQFSAIGKGDEFSGFRHSILQIARDTGVAASEVATVGFQMRGAFEPTTKAIHETEAAIKVALVTGLDQKELTDSLTAAAISYGVSIEDIGDKAIGLEERFGVLSRESLKVFGDLASSAHDAGLDLNELGAIIGVIQQRSGRAGSSISEGLGRVLPAIEGKAVDIARLYQSLPQLQGHSSQVIDALAQGRTGDVLLQLVRDYGSLDKATQQYVITLLGGRREAQLLIPLFEGSAQVIKELDRTQSDAGKTAERFTGLQHSLAQQMARFHEEVRQLGDALFRAGLGDFLLAAAYAGETFVRSLGGVLRVLGDINDATGGAVGKFALYAGAIATAATAFKALRTAAIAARDAEAAEEGTRGAGGIIGLLSGNGGFTRGVGSVLGGVGRFVSGRGDAFRAGYAAESAAAQGTKLSWLTSAAQPEGVALGGERVAGTVGGLGGLVGLSGAALPAAIVAASLVATGVAYKHQRDKARQVADWVTQALSKASDEQLDQIAHEHESFWSEVSSHIGLAPTGAQVAQRLQRKRQASTDPKVQDNLQRLTAYRDVYWQTGGEAAFNRAADANGPTMGYHGSIQKLLDAVNKGDKGAIAAADMILAEMEKDPLADQRLKNALKVYLDDQRKKSEQNNAAGVQTDDGLLQTVEEVKAAFEAGEVGYDKLIAAERQQVDVLAQLAGSDPQKMADLLTARRELNKAIADNVTSMLPILATLRQIGGGAGGLSTDPGKVAAGLGLGDITGALGARTPLPHPVIPSGPAGSSDPMQAAIDQAVATAEAATPTDAYSVSDPRERLQLAQQGAQVQIDAFNKAIGNQTSAVDALAAAKKGIKLDPAVRQAMSESLSAIYGHTIDVPEVIKASDEQLQQLQQKVIAEQIAKINAHAAQSNDLVEKARDQLRAAYLGVKNALNDTDRANALAAVFEAERNLDKTISDQASAHAELVIAQLTKKGDNIGAAKARLEEAKRKLAEAPAGTDQGTLDRLQAEVTNNEAAVRDTTLNERERAIDVALQLGKISTAQAIQQLKTLLQFPEITQEETDNLNLKIKQLMDQAAQSFNTNLGDIKLPTLYEVRRTAAANLAGVGYADNRNVSVTLYVTNGMTEAKAQQMLSDALGAPVRLVGQRPRSY